MTDHIRLFAVAVKNALRGPITVDYPRESRDYGDRLRGYIVNDRGKCISCGLCEAVCPAKAVKFSVGPDGKRYPGIDYGRCIFCGYCVDACPTGSLRHTQWHEVIWTSLDTFAKYAEGDPPEADGRPRRSLL
ncbi:MAG: 4Fe-4S binding protein [Thermoproteus sp.]